MIPIEPNERPQAALIIIGTWSLVGMILWSLWCIVDRLRTGVWP